MFNKVIAQMMDALPVIDKDTKEYFYANKALFKVSNAVRVGACVTLPGMDKQDMLVLVRDPVTQIDQVKHLFSSTYRIKPITIISRSKVGLTPNEGKQYVIDQGTLMDMARGVEIGLVLPLANSNDFVVVASKGARVGSVIHILREDVEELKIDQAWASSIIEKKLGRFGIIDPRIAGEDDNSNKKEIVHTLCSLLEDRTFDKEHVDRLHFKPGEFFQRVDQYLGVLERIDAKMVLEGGIPMEWPQYVQKAITIAVRMNIGLGRERYDSVEEYEQDVIRKVLKLGSKSFLKMTQPDTIADEIERSVEDQVPAKHEGRGRKKSPAPVGLSVDMEDNDILETKNTKYYSKHSGRVVVPREDIERTQAVIDRLHALYTIPTSDSIEIIAGAIKNVFDERQFTPVLGDYHKLVIALGEVLAGKTIRPEIKLTHTKHTSFFKLIAHAFNVEHYSTDTFAVEFKKALLLTLIDVNYVTHMSKHNGFLGKYKPYTMPMPAYNLPPARRLAYHEQVLKLIVQDPFIQDPFELFFVPTMTAKALRGGMPF